MIFSVQLDNLAVGERKDILYISNFRKKTNNPTLIFPCYPKRQKWFCLLSSCSVLLTKLKGRSINLLLCASSLKIST